MEYMLLNNGYTENLNLIFMDPCIVVYSINNQQDATW